MRIGDLPRRISGVWGDWIPEFPTRSPDKDGWIGFTPTSDHTRSRLSLRNSVMQRIGNGYMLEYVLLSPPRPNPTGRPLNTGRDKFVGKHGWRIHCGIQAGRPVGPRPRTHSGARLRRHPRSLGEKRKPAALVRGLSYYRGLGGRRVAQGTRHSSVGSCKTYLRDGVQNPQEAER